MKHVIIDEGHFKLPGLQAKEKAPKKALKKHARICTFQKGVKTLIFAIFLRFSFRNWDRFFVVVVVVVVVIVVVVVVVVVLVD